MNPNLDFLRAIEKKQRTLKQRYRDVLEQAKVRNRARKLDSTVLRGRHCRVDNVQSYREDKEDTDKSH